MHDTAESRVLYGGSRAWSATDWTSSDDRVRGGASTSSIDASASNPIATFLGHLDITALGGAGFASQRTTATTPLDLSSYDGIELDIEKSDGKRYTLVLKDEILPKRSDGREQSTVSWEYDFEIPEGPGRKIFVRWTDLKATYRGREKGDAAPLKRKSVRRISLMMRSFFGTQEGDFQLRVRSIAAVKKETLDDDARSSVETLEEKKKIDGTAKQGWLAWALGGCARL